MVSGKFSRHILSATAHINSIAIEPYRLHIRRIDSVLLQQLQQKICAVSCSFPRAVISSRAANFSACVTA